MGRRRRKVTRIPRKRLPHLFSCPKCGKETVRVELNSGQGRATVGCGSCGIKDEFQVQPVQGEIDIYCKFSDNFYKNSKKQSTLKIKK